MRSIQIRSCTFLGVICLLQGCVFDQKGVPAGSSLMDTGTHLLDAGTQDHSIDASAEQNPCSASKTPDFGICFFQSDEDKIGQVGVCQGKTFLRSRYCFAEAHCYQGSCFPSCSLSCIYNPCNPGQICTALFSASTIYHCCVTINTANGNKTALADCTKNEECMSGLCTSSGRCYKPCATNQDCPNSGPCKEVTLQEGQKTYHTLGCIKSTVDAGLDLGTDLGKDLMTGDQSIDAGIADFKLDHQIIDQALLDHEPADQAQGDAAKPLDIGAQDQTPIDQNALDKAAADKPMLVDQSAKDQTANDAAQD